MFRKAFLIFGLTVALATSAGADMITNWNQVLLQVIREEKTPPPRASRAIAMLNVAMFDAVNGIEKVYTPYVVTEDPAANANPDAAATAAAHTVLMALFPSQSILLNNAYGTYSGSIPAGDGKQRGLEYGRVVGQEILDLRANDHANDTVAFESPAGGGWWAPTGPAAALLPQWPRVTPFALNSGDQFRPDAPPSPFSAEYAAAFNETKRLGRADSKFRTAAQSQIALFWADGAGTSTPPGHWIEIAIDISEQQHLTRIQNARLFALLGIAIADAGIAAWDAKYAYSNWRPVTAIQHADQDGNPATTADPAWQPFITTPPFPAYISGHSTFSAAAARVLAHFFGTDNVTFTTGSGGTPGVERTFQSFSQAAAEAGQSRIYGGIHWQFDNQAGLATGRKIGDLVFFQYLRPRGNAGNCAVSDTTLCLNGGRFQVKATWNTGTASGTAHAVSLGETTGRFWFFDEDNTEVVVKVLDACAAFQKHWVFASGLTNVEVLLEVTDTETGEVRAYYNPRGEIFAPIQDVDAFGCP